MEEIDLSDISEEYADGWCQCPVKCEQSSFLGPGLFDCCYEVPRLGMKLTDDDIAGMLACIDAVHKLKSLHLGNCYRLNGTALEPLRGSTFLERLDLSLLGAIYDGDGNHFELFHQCNLSQTAVIPILNSIIDRQNHHLRHLQFPRDWRKNLVDKGYMILVGVGSGYFADFLEKYNATEHQQGIHCKKCGANCHECLSPVREDARFDGTQHFTCYDCLSHYCYSCKDEVENDFFLKFCDGCEKLRCRDCEPMVSCHCCTEGEEDLARRNGSYFCQLCSEEKKCPKCSHVFCQRCDDADLGLKVCTGCSKTGCDDCMGTIFCEHDGCDMSLCTDCNFQGGSENPLLDDCNTCFRFLCFKHRYEECKANFRSTSMIANGCLGCLSMVMDLSALPGVIEPSLLQG